MNEVSPQDAMAVANYVIGYAHEHGREITNLHLQKILYFLQAAFLVKYDSEIINGNFSKWNYGPVLKTVYYAYRDLGSFPIVDFAPNIDIIDGKWNIKEPQKIDFSKLNGEVINFLNETISNLLNKKPWSLVEITHNQELWKRDEQKIITHSADDYSTPEIRKYFITHPSDQIWRKENNGL
ncbi:Panacea domain-containing protein [Lactococcus lactis]|uniref:Phage-associated protein n=1 Tax=Lactococcus lactis TaxID=1358 RepID=A0AAW5TRD7_9LACT|nr:type II toxin-antitoxin system antitoxin SocA domain-containing protein [Lactococcus lactis]MCW2279545.1 putative phage-associated protein [Lactococcus lactis]